MLVPFLSLGSSTVRSNPLPGTSSHCKINRSSCPNKTQISEKKYEAISNHAYKRSKKTQITFMDKNIDLIINSKFIGSQQTHRQKTYNIWISKRPLYWYSREREEPIQLLTMDPKVYKELLTHHRRGTNESGEPHPRWCLDWIWWLWTLRWLDEYFVDSPRVLVFLGYL